MSADVTETPISEATEFLLNCGRVQRIAIRSAGIPANNTDWRCLHLIEQFGPMTTGEFSSRMIQAPSSSTRALARLEKKGLITHTPSKDDARVSILTITEEGKETCRRNERAVEKVLDTVFPQLTEEDRAALEAASPALNNLLSTLRAEYFK